jgi:hypothetical protein
VVAGAVIAVVGGGTVDGLCTLGVGDGLAERSAPFPLHAVATARPAAIITTNPRDRLRDAIERQDSVGEAPRDDVHDVRTQQELFDDVGVRHVLDLHQRR